MKRNKKNVGVIFSKSSFLPKVTHITNANLDSDDGEGKLYENFKRVYWSLNMSLTELLA